MKRIGFMIAVICGLATLDSASALTRNQPGRMASDFLAEIGTVVRISEGQDPAKLAPMIKYIGAQRVMDRYTVSPAALTSLGAKIALEVGRNATDATIPAFVAAAKTFPIASLYAFVGPDEPEHYPVTYQGNTCGPQNTSWHCISAWQMAWYKALKADPVLKTVHVTSPSDVSQETTNEGLQFAKIPATSSGLAAANASGNPVGTTFWDYGNTHCKQGLGNPPGVNQSWFCYYPYGFPTNGDATLESPVPNFETTMLKGYQGADTVGIRGVPSINTFSGVHTDGTATSDQLKGSKDLIAFADCFFFSSRAPNGVPNGTLGVFVPLLDTASTAGYGLFSSYTTPRPSAVYLHNLTMFLADVPTQFTPAQMVWTIGGDDAHFRSIGLEKTTGVFDVVAVDEEFPPNAGVPEPRLVSFPAVVSSARVFDPILGQVTATYNNVQSFTATWSSTHPIQIIEWKP